MRQKLHYPFPQSLAVFGLALPDGQNLPTKRGKGHDSQRIALAVAGDLRSQYSGRDFGKRPSLQRWSCQKHNV